jgi:hypothetical protein
MHVSAGIAQAVVQHHPPVSTYQAGAMATRSQKLELLVDVFKTTMLPVVEYELQKLEAEKDDANLFRANTQAALMRISSGRIHKQH